MKAESKRHEAEIYRLVEALQNGITLNAGQQYSVDARLGNEGFDSWTRWEFEATESMIHEAEEIFSK
jgi:hypothetical protein